MLDIASMNRDDVLYLASRSYDVTIKTCIEHGLDDAYEPGAEDATTQANRIVSQVMTSSAVANVPFPDSDLADLGFTTDTTTLYICPCGQLVRIAVVLTSLFKIHCLRCVWHVVDF